jgi:RNA polymerase sigma-70 factor (ECF subfamily)
MLRLTRDMTLVAIPSRPAAESVRPCEEPTPSIAIPSFAEVYQQYFDFVWRSARRLGVRETAVEDLVQEIFVIIHRRLPGFEGRSTLRTWLYGIVLRVAREHRRVSQRADARRGYVEDGECEESPDRGTLADEQLALAQVGRILEQTLDAMPVEQRDVFVMVELEELTIPETAALVGEKINTVYSRLRLARESFARAAARHRARDGWRGR